MFGSVRGLRIVLGLGLTLLSAGAWGAGVGEVGGHAVDARTLGGVSAATCLISGRPPVIADASGAFLITRVPVGSHTVRCEALGYKGATAQVVVTAGQRAAVRIMLKPTALSPADVVAQMEAKKQREVKEAEETSSAEAAPTVRKPAAAPVSSGLISALGTRGSGKGGGGIGHASGGAVGYGRGAGLKKGKSRRRTKSIRRQRPRPSRPMQIAVGPRPTEPVGDRSSAPHNTEDYKKLTENPFNATTKDPLSTLSIDVDTAGYSNVRRFINRSQLPPADAVKIEEMVNYFSYAYPDAKGDHPFSITTEVSVAPWNPKHRLVHLGLQARKVDREDMPRNNLVFLLDVSGSMNRPDKLPLLKAAFRLLVQNLRSDDRVAIVVYAGASGVALPSTPVKQSDTILAALDGLRSGGSTAGGAGIELAYKIAQKNFMKGGNNRIILATDGDFNVGVSSEGGLVRLIEKKRKTGIFLTVLGFGTGNYKASKMEQLADKGNGNFAYIDSILEAQKVLVKEMGGTLLTVAKDVKVQVEFNPARVKGWRLLGYENRILAAQDFNDDKKDAGELGAGHTVTVLYELIPAGSPEAVPGVDALKYQKAATTPAATDSGELMTVKLRYKDPKGSKSKLIVHPLLEQDIPFDRTSDDFRFSAAVAELSLLLRDSKFKGESSFDALIKRARGAMGDDPNGYRFEFIKLAEKAKLLKQIAPK